MISTRSAPSPDFDRSPASRKPGRTVGIAATATLALIGTVAVAAPAVSSPTRADGQKGARCSLNAKLVPSCGVLWGAAPAAFDYSSRVKSTQRFEGLIGRNLDINHGYKANNRLFPSADEIAIANGAGGSGKRLLLINYRPGMDMTWKAMASGKGDARLDRLAKYIRGHYTDKFFVSIWHEPEHFVKQSAGSGMTATDYRNMVRHVILRLKSKGVNNAVFVQIYQGYPKYAAMSWWKDLYPGDDVIDWIGTDSYNSGKTSGYNSGDFHDMVNRKKGSWQGWYNWATSKHPGKPLMIGEWGVFANKSAPTRQAWFYDQVRTQLSSYPAIKAMSYFNANKLDKGTTRIDANSASQSAYRKLSNSFPPIDLNR
ncbi:MAG: hypothetical protein L0H41_17105 [Microlunatus sp.]|nr:hypothetical protein [Microlunatus sp.]